MTFDKRLRAYLRQRHLTHLPTRTYEQRVAAVARLTPRQQRRIGPPPSGRKVVA